MFNSSPFKLDVYIHGTKDIHMYYVRVPMYLVINQNQAQHERTKTFQRSREIEKCIELKVH